MPLVNWLYPVNPASDYYLLDVKAGKRSRVTAENLWQSIERQPDEADSWYLSRGYRTLKPDDLVWIYVAGRQEICALGQVAQIEQHRAGTWHAQVLWNQEATKALEATPIPRSEFQQIPRSPCRAAAGTSKFLDHWLVAHSIEYTDPSDGGVPESDEDARRRALALIVRRRGQTAFRHALLDNYGGRCAATEENAAEVLEAAHIDPYRGAQSNIASNGILLRSDIHTLFDLNLIGVDESRKWVVSPRLAGTSYASLAGRPLREPTKSRPGAVRLARHLKQLAT
jgi:HNH endonuclease